jgi:hypothetical protein
VTQLVAALAQLAASGYGEAERVVSEALQGGAWSAAPQPAPSLGADECDEGPGPWIVERQSVGLSREVKRYAPLARATLHRDFAKLDGKSERRVLGFANEYGHLGDSQALLAAVGGPQPVLIGESLGRWRRECGTLRQLVDLWDDARGAKNRGEPVDAELAGRIVWEQGPPRRVVLAWPDHGLSAIVAMEAPPDGSAPGYNAGALATWTDQDLAAPARFYVFERVNKAIRGQASPAVLPIVGSELAIVPHTLLAALYVLFALELSGRARDLRQCENCGAYFYPARSDQRLCGVSCRRKRNYHVKGGKPRTDT